MRTRQLLVVGVLFLAGCGNVATTKSFTPEQRLKITENGLGKVGITFDASNAISKCESIYKVTCQGRVASLKDFINELFSNFGSEDNMPQAYQQRLTSANACLDLLNADLISTTSTNCHR